MRAIGVALTLCCACNQVFGLKETMPIDAQRFDAPPDAPFTCPAPGTQPQFSGSLRQAIAKNCLSYTTSIAANRGVAFCVAPDGIYDGPIDEVPVQATLSPAIDADFPRITPEGDEIWVRHRGTATPSFAVYAYAADHQWTYVRDLMVGTVGTNDIITAPSKKIGGKRRFVEYVFQSFRLDEYEDDGAIATLVHSYNVQADLGIDFVAFPNLDADGLRLVFAGELQSSKMTQTLYMDRATIDAAFQAPTVLATAPVVYDPFLAADCSKLYTSGLGSIFYAPQL